MKKIILDLDTGIDDTLAIVYTLAAPDAELIGITGAFGNVNVDRGVRNALGILAMFGRDDVPVYRGCDRGLSATEPYEPTWEEHALWHGHNGVGDVDIPATPRRPAAGNAVDFVIDSVRKHPKGDPEGEVVVVPTGCSTNIATALKKAPDIIDKITIVTMGGSLTQPGNASPFAEANATVDPEATDYMYSTAADITMVGLDVTMQALMTEEDVDELGKIPTRTAQFLHGMLLYYLGVSKKYDPSYLGGCNLHDPLAAAVAIDPSLVKTFPINLMCETEGPSAGRTIGDPRRLLAEPKNTKVALQLDRERFKGLFMKHLFALASGAGKASNVSNAGTFGAADTSGKAEE
ncbi:MAG: nucleoside hydrolase [Parascardovia denticolens]